MSEHFADRLWRGCKQAGAPVCVGLDPVLERLPEQVSSGRQRRSKGSRGDRGAGGRLEAFCIAVLDAVAPHVPAVKVQAACFERYGSPGWAALEQVIQQAQARGLMVILDAKRGDVGHSAEHYAAGLLGYPGVDAITVNPYLGMDTLEPFVSVAAQTGKGVFVLVRTSNPGSASLQGLALADGRGLAEAVADQVAALGQAHVGRCGYSSIGAVVGATQTSDLTRLRDRMPKQILLVPGLGAQGGQAEDARSCFDDQGQGALITASRSVIYAYEHTNEPWATAIASAAKRLKDAFGFS